MIIGGTLLSKKNVTEYSSADSLKNVEEKFGNLEIEEVSVVLPAVDVELFRMSSFLLLLE